MEKLKKELEGVNNKYEDCRIIISQLRREHQKIETANTSAQAKTKSLEENLLALKPVEQSDSVKHDSENAQLCAQIAALQSANRIITTEREKVTEQLLESIERDKLLRGTIRSHQKEIDCLVHMLNSCLALKDSDIARLQSQIDKVKNDANTCQSSLWESQAQQKHLGTQLTHWKDIVLTYVARVEGDMEAVDLQLENVLQKQVYFRPLGHDRQSCVRKWLRSLESSGGNADPVATALRIWSYAIRGPISYEDVMSLCRSMALLSKRDHFDFVLALIEDACAIPSPDTAHWTDDNWMGFLRLTEIIGYVHKTGDVRRLAPVLDRLKRVKLQTASTLVRAQFDFIIELLTPECHMDYGLDRSLLKLANELVLKHGMYKLLTSGNSLVVVNSDVNAPCRVRIFDPTAFTVEFYNRQWALKVNNLKEVGMAHRLIFDNNEVWKFESVFLIAVESFMVGEWKYLELAVEG